MIDNEKIIIKDYEAENIDDYHADVLTMIIRLCLTLSLPDTRICVNSLSFFHCLFIVSSLFIVYNDTLVAKG